MYINRVNGIACQDAIVYILQYSWSKVARVA